MPEEESSEKRNLICVTGLSAGLLARLTPDFYVLGREALEEVMKIDGIRAYEPRYMTITGQRTFEQERELILQMFARNMFNIVNYLNPNSRNFSIYVRKGEELQFLFDQMQSDIAEGYVPFRYGLFLGMNLAQVRKFGGERQREIGREL